MDKQFRSFDQFYAFYLTEHRFALTRALHLLGLSMGLLCLIFCLIDSSRWPWIWLCLVFGYGPSWVGHFFVEKNRPATFQYPLFSLQGDLRMACDILRHRRLLFEKAGASKKSAS